MSMEKLKRFVWHFDREKWRQYLDSDKEPAERFDDAEQVGNELILAASMIDDALNDYCAYKFYEQPDEDNREEVEAYIALILETADELEAFFNEGEAKGLSVQEIALVDSLFGVAPNAFPEDCVQAAREIWQGVAPHVPQQGTKKSVDEEHRFVLAMRDTYILPIVAKYDIELEQFDLGPKPIGYVTSWLNRLYEGDDDVE